MACPAHLYPLPRLHLGDGNLTATLHHEVQAVVFFVGIFCEILVCTTWISVLIVNEIGRTVTIRQSTILIHYWILHIACAVIVIGHGHTPAITVFVIVPIRLSRDTLGCHFNAQLLSVLGGMYVQAFGLGDDQGVGVLHVVVIVVDDGRLAVSTANLTDKFPVMSV